MTAATQIHNLPVLEPAAGATGDTGSLIAFCQPESGKVVARIRDCGDQEVDHAVAGARRAFLENRKQARHVRIGWLKAAADIMEACRDELALIVSADVGKPLRAASFEVGRGIAFLHATAAAAGELGGEMLPLEASAAGAGTIGMTRRVPFGVVAGITPFNAPINLLIQKVAPAIAMGNAIVVKPALSGTRVALRLAELFVEAGWPQGLFCVVTGDREPAHLLAAHKDVQAVTFTGGTQAGHALARSAGAKKFLAELGSNAANIVMSDADLPRAADKLALAGFEASGQQCISAQRILVQTSTFDEFMSHFVKAASALKVGAPSDPDADLGPMVHEAAARRVMDMFDDALKHGGTCALKPERHGAAVSPGIVTDVPRGARIWSEEVFGPLVVVERFGTVEEALEIANDSEFGLQAALFTNDLALTMRFADDLDVGSMWVNEPSRFRLDIYPFGGVKQSGVGREGVRYALEELSQIKFIGIRPHSKKEN